MGVAARTGVLLVVVGSLLGCHTMRFELVDEPGPGVLTIYTAPEANN